jgi:hypothetical protein
MIGGRRAVCVSPQPRLVKMLECRVEQHRAKEDQTCIAI